MIDSVNYTPAQIRLAYNGLLGIDDPQWRTALEKSERETEGFALVLCSYLEFENNADRAWSAAEFERALDNFKGSAYSSLFGVCRDQLADEIGQSHMEHVDPFMDWGVYHRDRFKGVQIYYNDMWWHFEKVMT
jgi:hypothetical protein